MARKAAQLREAYKGQLQTPILLPPEPAPPPHHWFEKGDMPENDIDTLKKYYASQLADYMESVSPILLKAYEKKMPLLVKKHGLDINSPTVWQALALELAIDHVPGFKVKYSTQKRLKWTPVTFAKFYLDVEAELDRLNPPSKTIGRACNKLIKKQPWCYLISERSGENRGSGPTPKTLSNYYSEACESIFIKMYLRSKSDPNFENKIKKIFVKHINEMFDEEQKVSQ